jgi:hypothetical protein
MTAESTWGSQELDNLQLLKKRSQGMSSKYIVESLDAFVHQGPNGRHQCLVFELLGPTVNTILEMYDEDNLETDTIVRLSEQLLEAIGLIHDTGMGHGGNANLYLSFSIFHIH